MKLRSNIVLLFGLLTFTGITAQAEPASHQEGRNFYLGALAGANFPSGNFGTNVSPIFGVTLGAKVHPMLGVGFFGTYNGQYSSGSFLGLSTSNSISRFVLTGEANVYFHVFHAGVNVGAEINSWASNFGSASIGATSNAGFIFGPEVGADLPLSDLVSIGAEVHYFLTTLQNSQGNLVAAANIKFWL